VTSCLLVKWSFENFRDEVGEFDVSIEILNCLRVLQDFIDLFFGQLLSQKSEHMPQLGGGDESLSLPVESLEGFVEVVEGAGVFDLGAGGEDGEELLELVALLSELLGAAVAFDLLLGGVEAQAVQHVAGLEGVDFAVTAIPEVKELEDITDLFDLVSGEVGGSCFSLRHVCVWFADFLQ